MRIFVIAALAALMLNAATLGETAQAAVAGPSGAMQDAGRSLDSMEQIRRVCRTKLKCVRFLQCRFEKTCSLTRDYPPHRR
jgi:hypothetical protein